MKTGDVKTRILQLCPPTMAGETRALADSVLSAAGEGERDICRRPGWDFLRLVSTGYRNFPVIHAVGSALLACAATRATVFYSPDVVPSVAERLVLQRLRQRTPVFVLSATAAGRLRLGRNILTSMPADHCRVLRPDYPSAAAPTPADRTTAPRTNVERHTIKQTTGIQTTADPTGATKPTANQPIVNQTATDQMPAVPSQAEPTAGERIGRGSPLRQRLGLTPEDRVMLAVGSSSSRDANHRLALWAAAILGMVDRRWKLLVTGVGSQTESLRRFASDAGAPNLVVFAADLAEETGVATAPSYPDLIAAADYAVLTSPGPTDSLPLLQALSAGLPVVAIRSVVSEEFLPGPCLVELATPKGIARRLLDLSEQPQQSQEQTLQQHQFLSRFRHVDAWGELGALLASSTAVSISRPAAV